jgi:hypothetical protein
VSTAWRSRRKIRRRIGENYLRPVNAQAPVLAGSAENGRGMTLMNALSDLAVCDSVDGEGGSIHLTKRLRWVQGAQEPVVASNAERPR